MEPHNITHKSLVEVLERDVDLPVVANADPVQTDSNGLSVNLCSKESPSGTVSLVVAEFVYQLLPQLPVLSVGVAIEDDLYFVDLTA